jgi:hypothetical protein
MFWNKMFYWNQCIGDQINMRHGRRRESMTSGSSDWLSRGNLEQFWKTCLNQWYMVLTLKPE